MKYKPWFLTLGLTLTIVNLVNVYVDPSFYIDSAGKLVLTMGLAVAFTFLAHSFGKEACLK